MALKMKPRNSGVPQCQTARTLSGEGPNWILIAGGALLSTLSIRLGYKLKQADAKKQENSTNGNGKFSDRRQSEGSRLHSNVYTFTQDEYGCCKCSTGNHENEDQLKHHPNGQMLTETNASLPLVTIPPPDFNKHSSVIWSSSPDRLEHPPKPFHQSNCSDSPCVSESGSDIYTKREVIHKLRQQLKRRDDMILEMQDQILSLQNSLNSQISHASHLQSQIDAVNRDLFDSEREIVRLRKAIADHCVNEVSPNENGHFNREFSENGRGGDGEKIEMLKKEVGELKEVIEGKQYLLESYKEQKTEMFSKIKELQQRLDSQLPNIL